MEPWHKLWNRELVADNTVGNFAIFSVAVILTLALARSATWLASARLRALTERTATKLDDILLATLERPLYYVVLLMGGRLASNALVLPAFMSRTIASTTLVAVTVLVAWTLHRLIDAVYAGVVRPWIERTDSRLDSHIVPVLRKAMKLCVWTFSVLICFSNLGVDIVSLLTGLGLGGLAVAMAAQDTLANVFGSATIVADRPFQVGDLVRVGSHTGVVQEVGLRTCRIRTLQGALVTIPNKEIASTAVTNLSHTQTWRHDGSVGLVYAMSSSEVRAAMDIIEGVLREHAAIADNFAVRFMSFADSSLKIDFAFFVKNPDPARYLNTISDVNLAIKERFDASHVQLALPSLTLYLADPPSGLEALTCRALSGPRKDVA